MSARSERRNAERTRLNAAACRVPLTEWAAMSRRERRLRLERARREGRS